MPYFPHSQQPSEPFPQLASVREYIRPEILEYYELRSRGLIRARSYEEWAIEALEDAEFQRMVARTKVRMRFRRVQWDTGFWSMGAREVCGCEECEMQAAGR